LTGGPLKPAFGLSGAVLLLDRVFLPLFRVLVSSIGGWPIQAGFWLEWGSSAAHSLSNNGSASHPTLNFAKNAKIRMGHPREA
jgi:hypothetical protein